MISLKLAQFFDIFLLIKNIVGNNPVEIQSIQIR